MPTQKAMNVLKEFQEFINKGNVIDLAVGVIMGASFGKITESLVKDIMTPPIGFVLANLDFSKLAWTIPTPDGKGVAITYGLFIQASINFIITAFAVFWLVKVVNRLRAKPPEPGVPPPKPDDVLLLTEIRDLLKKQNGPSV